MKKIDTEVAQQDLDRFIDNLKVNPIKLDSLEDEKEKCLQLIEYGQLIINKDDVAIFKPYTPFNFGDNSIEEIEFASRRITVKEMEKNLIGKSDSEKTRRLMAFLIKKPSAFLQAMDADDYTNFANIAAFFLPR